MPASPAGWQGLWNAGRLSSCLALGLPREAAGLLQGQASWGPVSGKEAFPPLWSVQLTLEANWGPSHHPRLGPAGKEVGKSTLRRGPAGAWSTLGGGGMPAKCGSGLHGPKHCLDGSRAPVWDYNPQVLQPV